MPRCYVAIPLLMTTAVALVGCNVGGSPGPTETATLTSQNVMETAQAIAEATRQAITPTETRAPVTATPTPIPETPTPTASATPESALLIADYNANVRSGPGEEFDAIDYLLQGDQANVVGRFLNDQSGTWYYITRVDQGLPGWIWGGAVSVAGNESTIPFLDSPPTPTPGPSPTPTKTS
jgi:uncharacterized protein YgiM (DUF1202 family)